MPVKSRGTVLKQDISNVLTAVAGIIDLKWDGIEVQTTAVDTLDNASAGIPHMATGATEWGNVSGNLYFDPDLAGHQALMAQMKTPGDKDYELVFADTNSTNWGFVGAGIGMGIDAALGEALKSSFNIKVDGQPTGI